MSGSNKRTHQTVIDNEQELSLQILGRYWSLYFPRIEFGSIPASHLDDIRRFTQYLRRHPDSFNMNTDFSCTFDYQLLTNTGQQLPDLAQRMRNEPEYLLCCLGLSVCYVLSSEFGPQAEHTLGDHRLHIRLLHYEPLTHMKALKSGLVGTLVSVRGTVVRTSPIKPLLTQAEFRCIRCGGSQAIKIIEGKYETPAKCLTQGCKSRVFDVCRNAESATRTVDWQQIRIQEKVNDDPKDPGRVPRSIDAELMNDLVDSVVPGDVVTCTGIVKVVLSDEGKGRGRPNSLYILYLDTVSINRVGSNSNPDGDNSEEMTTKDGIHFSNKDLQFIRDVSQESQLFRLLVNSFSPGIFGHEVVKAGIMLALFGARKRIGSSGPVVSPPSLSSSPPIQQGGNQETNNNPTETQPATATAAPSQVQRELHRGESRGSISIRSDSHVLVVGDPGLGKSQMLSAVGQIAPRGVYVCGTSGISSSGLTVTLVKEAGSGDFALEAGALVLSDMGCCAIDEFDKVTSEHSSLLEAMEQQSISIAKGGLVCSLPARASVIAAANPAGGHYNKAKTVAENLRINSALLSRFDLVFILLDRPDTHMDRFLSEHVMSLHSGSSDRSSNGFSLPSSAVPASQMLTALDSSETTIKQRLQVKPGEGIDAIPPPLLRKYVAYARKYVHPRLNPESTEKLKQFYLELRKKHRTLDSTPITTRQLEALIRLAEARARAELREEVTAEDAQDVIDIMRYSLFQTYEDEEGLMDFSRSQMGTGVSRTSDIKRLVEKLHRISEQTYNNIFSYDMLLQTATEMNLRFSNFHDVVDRLNNQNFIIKKGPRTYQLTTF